MWWWNAQGWWSLQSQVLAAVMTVVIFGFGLLALWLVLNFLRTKDRGPDDILAERFASGELDEVDYRRQLDVLRETLSDDEAQHTSV